MYERRFVLAVPLWKRWSAECVVRKMAHVCWVRAFVNAHLGWPEATLLIGLQSDNHWAIVRMERDLKRTFESRLVYIRRDEAGIPVAS